MKDSRVDFLIKCIENCVRTIIDNNTDTFIVGKEVGQIQIHLSDLKTILEEKNNPS